MPSVLLRVHFIQTRKNHRDSVVKGLNVIKAGPPANLFTQDELYYGVLFREPLRKRFVISYISSDSEQVVIPIILPFTDKLYGLLLIPLEQHSEGGVLNHGTQGKVRPRPKPILTGVPLKLLYEFPGSIGLLYGVVS